MQISTRKDVPHHFPLEKCKLKPQRDITALLLERLKLKMMTTPSAGEDCKQLELLYITSGNAKLYSHSRK